MTKAGKSSCCGESWYVDGSNSRYGICVGCNRTFKRTGDHYGVETVLVMQEITLGLIIQQWQTGAVDIGIKDEDGIHWLFSVSEDHSLAVFPFSAGGEVHVETRPFDWDWKCDGE